MYAITRMAGVILDTGRLAGRTLARAKEAFLTASSAARIAGSALAAGQLATGRRSRPRQSQLRHNAVQLAFTAPLAKSGFIRVEAVVTQGPPTVRKRGHPLHRRWDRDTKTSLEDMKSLRTNRPHRARRGTRSGFRCIADRLRSRRSGRLHPGASGWRTCPHDNIHRPDNEHSASNAHLTPLENGRSIRRKPNPACNRGSHCRPPPRRTEFGTSSSHHLGSRGRLRSSHSKCSLHLRPHARRKLRIRRSPVPGHRGWCRSWYQRLRKPCTPMGRRRADSIPPDSHPPRTSARKRGRSRSRPTPGFPRTLRSNSPDQGDPCRRRHPVAAIRNHRRAPASTATQHVGCTGPLLRRSAVAPRRRLAAPIRSLAIRCNHDPNRNSTRRTLSPQALCRTPPNPTSPPASGDAAASSTLASTEPSAPPSVTKASDAASSAPDIVSTPQPHNQHAHEAQAKHSLTLGAPRRRHNGRAHRALDEGRHAFQPRLQPRPRTAARTHPMHSRRDITLSRGRASRRYRRSQESESEPPPAPRQSSIQQWHAEAHHRRLSSASRSAHR